MVMDSGASVKWSWKMYKKIKNNKKNLQQNTLHSMPTHHRAQYAVHIQTEE